MGQQIMEQTMGSAHAGSSRNWGKRDIIHHNYILLIINFYRTETNVLTELSSLGVCEEEM